MSNLSRMVETRRVLNAVAAGQTEQPASSVDMAGYETVVFRAFFGTLTATAVTGLKVQQSDDDGSTDDWTDLSGAVASIADDEDNLMLEIEVYRPLKRYLRAVVTRGTANAVIDGVEAQLFGARKLPAAQHTTMAARAFVASPAEA